MMNIEKLRNFEPLFGSWNIDKKLSEGRSSVFYRVYRENENGTEFLGLKTIRFPRTEADFNRVMQSGRYSDPEQYLTVLESELRRNMEKMMSLRANSNVVRFDNYMIVREFNCFHVIILMEMLKPLSEYLTENKVSSKEIAKMGADLCCALEGFRKEGIMHREIKPENIFVDDAGMYKLGDFGISSIGEIGDSREELSTYLAPEVIYKKGADTCSDVYSLGILMYKLMNNNRVPFLPEYPAPISVDDRKRAFERRMSGERLVKPAKADLELTKIIFKAAAFRVEERYQYPAQLEEDLRRYLFGVPQKANEQPTQPIYRSAEGKDIYFDSYAPKRTTYDADSRAKDEFNEAFSDSAEDDKPNNKKWYALIAVLVVVLAVVVVFVVKGVTGGNDETSAVMEQTSISTITQATEPPTTEAPTTAAPTTTEPPTTEAPTTEAPTTTEPPTTEAPTTEATTVPETTQQAMQTQLFKQSTHKDGDMSDSGKIYTDPEVLAANMSLSGDEIVAATVSLQEIGSNPIKSGSTGAYICQVDKSGIVLVKERADFGIIYDEDDEGSTLACEFAINNELYYEDNTDYFIVFDEGAIETDTAISLPFQVKLELD